MIPNPSGRLVAAYDLDANRVLLPEHVRQMPAKKRKAWMTEHGLVPAVGGGSGYSWCQMLEPFQVTDAVTIAAVNVETVVTQDTYFTLPANFFSYVGKMVWMRIVGKQSNVVTTPGTVTFRLRYNGVGGTLLQTSGVITPNPVAVTDNLWYCDLFVQCIAMTASTNPTITLLTHGEVRFANNVAPTTTALAYAGMMPPPSTSLANVASLDGTAAKALTFTAQPTLSTLTVTARNAFIVALN